MYREISILFSKFLDRYNYLIENSFKDTEFKGLGASHFAILIGIIMCDKKKLCMKDIANFINKDKSTVTQLVNKLIKYDLIEKKYSESDRRICYVILTEKGMENEELFKSIYKRTEFSNSEVITNDEKKILEGIVKKLILNLE